LQVPPELVESCRRDEPGAFDELVRMTHRSVYSLVYRIVGNPDDAADVTQDVYLRVWRGLRSFRGDANVSTWLYRVAANAALTHIKRRARAGAPVAPEDMPDVPSEDGAEGRADAALLEQALLRLPPPQRAAVVLKDVYGWSCEEIGRHMGATEGAVKVRLFRARQRLADELASAGVVVPMKKRKKSS
jgi:RNA polymerase sigma-70 factor, ECF subfamily